MYLTDESIRPSTCSRVARTSTRRVFAFLAVSIVLSGIAPAQLRIVSYNIEGGQQDNESFGTYSARMNNILDGLENWNANGISRPVDVFSLQEMGTPPGSSNTSEVNEMLSVLNTKYGAGTYAASTTIAGGFPPGDVRLIYNTNTVTLNAETVIANNSISGVAAPPRQSVRYELTPVGYSNDATFYLYGSHLKASGSERSSEAQTRQLETSAIRADADALGPGAHIIYSGDFNVRGHNDFGFQEYTNSGDGRAVDPIDSLDFWRNQTQYRSIHTQATRGGNDGGMDDRFDFQLVTSELTDGEGTSYIGIGLPGNSNFHVAPSTHSYTALGNDGTHTINEAITTGSGDPTLLNALMEQSQHLPVVADYQLPAILEVNSVSTPTPKVIIGAVSQMNFTVENVAPVSTVNGADELDYTASGNGSAFAGTSPVAGVDNPLGSGNNHSFLLSTTTAGVQSGTLNVSTTSQQADAPSLQFSQNISYDVIAHSNATFDSNVATDDDAETLNVGTFTQGSGPQTVTFQICNLETVDDFTADLVLDPASSTGDTSTLTTDLTTGQITAGNCLNFTATLDTSNLGMFAAMYMVPVRDESLPGATSNANLTLNLSGTVVVPEPDSFIVCLPLFGILAATLRRRRGYTARRGRPHFVRLG